MKANSLVKSKKARSAWIGGAAITVVTILLYKAGIPESLITPAITAIAGLFGSQIIGQAYQDGKKKTEVENTMLN